MGVTESVIHSQVPKRRLSSLQFTEQGITEYNDIF